MASKHKGSQWSLLRVVWNAAMLMDVSSDHILFAASILRDLAQA